eukprot:s2455_g7.t1
MAVQMLLERGLDVAPLVHDRGGKLRNLVTLALMSEWKTRATLATTDLVLLFLFLPSLLKDMIPLLNWRRSCRGSLPGQHWDYVFQQTGSVGSSVFFHNGDDKGACAVLPDGDHPLRSDRCGFKRRKEAASDLKHCAALFGSDFMQRTDRLKSEDESASLSRRESGDTARA